MLALRRNVTLKSIGQGPKTRLDEAVSIFEQNEIHSNVDKVFAFDQAKDALQYVAEGNHFSKVVLDIV